ncbi:MAG TPA: exopolysaccharide biosynthesis protein [Caulobacter sp.]|nr:exopolysaccharide biosynthesis protein [Caulobacter sp.]
MESNERRLTLSAILVEICDDPEPTITVGEIVDRFGHRAFGAMLFFFSAPNWLPLPPGSSTFLAMPLIVLTPQMVVGVQGPWLPRFIEDRTMKRAELAGAIRKIVPMLRRIETVSRPRLSFLFGPVGDRLIGLTCFLLALVLLLPIPLGNMAPAAAIAALGLAMVQRDGVIALIGYAAAALSAGLLVFGGQAALLALRELFQWLGIS